LLTVKLDSREGDYRIDVGPVGNRMLNDLVMHCHRAIITAKLNDIDPPDVLARIADTPQNRLLELLPWKWKTSNLQAAASAMAAISYVYIIRRASL
jgi:hypothetical protein